MVLTNYTKQEDRFDRAFQSRATSSSITCEYCGRVYFVTSPGHGEYEPGTLEFFRQKAEQSPDMFIEVPDYSSVAWTRVNNKQLVIGCECGTTERICNGIEAYAQELTDYLIQFWKARHAELTQQQKDTAEYLDALEQWGETP